MMETAGNIKAREVFAKTDLGQTADSYGLLPQTGGTPNKQSLRKSINKAKGLESATSLAKATGVDPSKLEGLDESSIYSLIRGQKETNANESWESSPQTKQEQDRYYDLQQDKLADRKDARDALLFSREQAQNQRMFARRESSLDRSQTQDLAILSQGHQMKLAQMNQDLAEKRMGL